MKKHKEMFIDIGTRIKTSREESGYTQEALADKTGLSARHISAIERGVNGPSLYALVRICKTLHISTDYILMGINKDSFYNSPFSGLNFIPPEEQQTLIHSVSILHEAINYNAVPDDQNKTSDL